MNFGYSVLHNVIINWKVLPTLNESKLSRKLTLKEIKVRDKPRIIIIIILTY